MDRPEIAHDRRPFAASIVIALLLVLGACGPLPRPFIPDSKHDATLSAVGQSAAVLVLPLEGDAPGDSAAATAELVGSLRSLGIAAATDAAAVDRLLLGRASVSRNAEGQDAVAIDWQVRDPSGTTLGAFQQVSQLPGGLWAQGQPAAVGSVMARAAQQAAALLRDRPDPAATSPAKRPRLVLLPIEDLPGDGAYSLPRALERSLTEADYEIGWDIEAGDLLILAEMTAKSRRRRPGTGGLHLVGGRGRRRHGSGQGRPGPPAADGRPERPLGGSGGRHRGRRRRGHHRRHPAPLAGLTPGAQISPKGAIFAFTGAGGIDTVRPPLRGAVRGFGRMRGPKGARQGTPA